MLNILNITIQKITDSLNMKQVFCLMLFDLAYKFY